MVKRLGVAAFIVAGVVLAVGYQRMVMEPPPPQSREESLQRLDPQQRAEVLAVEQQLMWLAARSRR